MLASEFGTGMGTYYTAKNGAEMGPFEEAEMVRQLESGVLSPQDLCWREGMSEWQPIATVLSLATVGPPAAPAQAGLEVGASKAPLFLHIPVSRLVILSILSFSLYEAYWIYRNWRYVKERDGLSIRPFWRGVFGIFHCHTLLQRIHGDTEARLVRVPAFSPALLASGWVLLAITSNLVSRAPGMAASVLAAMIPSFLFLVPVQRYVNAVSEGRSPGRRYYPWSMGHVLCLVLGVILWVSVLTGFGVE